MVNAQEWLDKNYYPQEIRAQITDELNISYRDLEGELDLRDFINLEKLICLGNQLTDINLSNCQQLKQLNCSHNNLTTLVLNNFPHLEEIYCHNNNLTELNVSNNHELKELNCQYNNSLTTLNVNVNNNNNLTELICWNCNLNTLNVNNNPQLEWLKCYNNQLTNLQFLNNLNPDRLTGLDIRNNNFAPSELTVFSKFINLTELYIDSKNEKRINQGIYNRFVGSLAPLANLTKLKKLDISSTDIDSGLEYLPSSLEGFWFTGKLVQELKHHPELIANAQEIVELETILTNLDSYLISSHPQSETIFIGINVFSFETRSKINELISKNRKYYQSEIELPPKQ